MTDKELGKLRRSELLELLLEQAKETEQLRAELTKTQKRLESRELKLEQAGSIAEAALQVNGVFDAAQAAAAQYLENIEKLSERQEAICAAREEESLRKAEQMLAEAQLEKEKRQEECTKMEEHTQEQCEELAKRAREQCEDLIQQTKKQCEEMKQQAESQVEEKWKEISERLEVFYKAHEDLREILTF